MLIVAKLGLESFRFSSSGGSGGGSLLRRSWSVSALPRRDRFVNGVGNVEN